MPGIKSGIGRFAGDFFAAIGSATPKGRASIGYTQSTMRRHMAGQVGMGPPMPVGMRRKYVTKKSCVYGYICPRSQRS